MTGCSIAHQRPAREVRAESLEGDTVETKLPFQMEQQKVVIYVVKHRRRVEYDHVCLPVFFNKLITLSMKYHWWSCVVEMLKLIRSKRCPSQAASTTVPQHIMLCDGLMTVGRSYKADVKIMLPYISRKHFSVNIPLSLLLIVDCRIVCFVAFIILLGHSVATQPVFW